MSFRSLFIVCLAITHCALAGCKTHAPLHVWRPPSIQSAVGKRIVISEVAGPTHVTKPLIEQLLHSAPQEQGRKTTIAHSDVLKFSDEIRLVSATDSEPSDIALQAAARSEGFDFVLRGEVLHDRGSRTVDEGNPHLTVSWRLTELNDSGSIGGMPVAVNYEDAIQRYPDLALASDKQLAVTTAVARDTNRLVAPWLDRDQFTLAKPWLLPGSRKVRAGNLAAQNGRWGEAKAKWTNAADKHPLQVSAIHNLAVAAIAAQDFTTAMRMARKAVRLQPTTLHKATLRKTEMLQREYHSAFQLSDPPEGWYLTQGTE